VICIGFPRLYAAQATRVFSSALLARVRGLGTITVQVCIGDEIVEFRPMHA
jgi:hypothetical protein